MEPHASSSRVFLLALLGASPPDAGAMPSLLYTIAISCYAVTAEEAETAVLSCAKRKRRKPSCFVLLKTPYNLARQPSWQEIIAHSGTATGL